MAPNGTYLKKALKTEEQAFSGVEETVSKMLAEIRTGGEPVVLRYAKQFDKYDGPVVVTREEMQKAGALVPEETRRVIEYAHQRVKAFAEAQRKSVRDFEVPIGTGGVAGQRIVPMNCAGCYCPGGRYSHLASAIMSCTTARAAGVRHVILASPPRPGVGIPPVILYAAYVAGADAALALGGIQAIASLRYGFFTGTEADILVGPGSGFVAEAKRQLAGPNCAIDLFAGPTEICVIADATADSEVVAADLVSQAEHGPTSPAWLVTTDRALGEQVCRRVPQLLEALPEPNRTACRTAWRDYGEVVLAASDADAVQFSDNYAPEHLEVLCREDTLGWWLRELRNYGSLFLGEGTCVTYGDKASGPNHTLPTRRAAKHTGGLSVHKFLKVLTWQKQDTACHEELGVAAALISRAEGMEGHAWAADVRLAKHAKSQQERERLLRRCGAEGAGTAHLWRNGVVAPKL
eukprot:TRINITY_DN11661_c0_g1_i1.p2 TRINITY_DN11661_c0_g1~~TRINITY_DN11661_c0_g1_i1.p2  ORF type:complete len:491 (+),score=148.72 TRINITY_DN11661_c0_g1_i1:85-1473(+)